MHVFYMQIMPDIQIVTQEERKNSNMFLVESKNALSDQHKNQNFRASAFAKDGPSEIQIPLRGLSWLKRMPLQANMSYASL